jgi:uncharacterized protein YkwD
MTVTLRLLILTSLGLALGACSGGDSSDAAVDDGTTNTTQPSTPAPAGPPGPAATGEAEPNAPTMVDEGAPDVTGIDESMAPRASANGAEQTPSTDDPAAGASADPAAELALPDTELCAAVADWDPAWAAFEEEVLALVNELRSEPADCGVEGQFAAAAPLTMNPILRCSARLHSLDMYERDYFDHDTPDGVDPLERMVEAGFVGSGGGENIALGQSTPEEVMAAWMDSDGHCANIMRASFDTIGIGYHPGAGQRGLGSNYWTQNFGAPAFARGGGSQR